MTWVAWIPPGQQELAGWAEAGLSQGAVEASGLQSFSRNLSRFGSPVQSEEERNEYQKDS